VSRKLAATPNRRFEFNKRHQLFVGMPNETLSVAAMCVCNLGCSRVGSIAETQPQLQPALLRLSAMISQYRFTQRDSAYFSLHTAMTK
jgi:hypothetical protein